MNRSCFALLGPGRLGLRLARQLVSRGHECVAIRGRGVTPEDSRRLLPATTIFDRWDRPQARTLPPLVLLTVPDGSIGQVADQLASSFDLEGVTVMHTSGLRSSEELRACQSTGALVASWHPLQSFPSLEHGGVELEGVPCAIEGDPGAEAVGFELAAELGLRPWRIALENKAMHHASAAVAANLTHILVACAADQLRHCGLPEGGPGHPLLPLVDTSLRAALRSPRFAGLSGPIARHDTATINRHSRYCPPHWLRSTRSWRGSSRSRTDAAMTALPSGR